MQPRIDAAARRPRGRPPVAAKLTKPTVRATPLGIRVDGSWSQVQVDGDGITFDRQVWSGLGGVDYALNDQLALGLAGDYENRSSGASSMHGGISGGGFKLAPRAVYRLDA